MDFSKEFYFQVLMRILHRGGCSKALQLRIPHFGHISRKPWSAFQQYALCSPARLQHTVSGEQRK